MRPPELYLPTPEEIAAKCAEIRSTWSDGERQSRLGKIPLLADCDFTAITAAAKAENKRRLSVSRSE